MISGFLLLMMLQTEVTGQSEPSAFNPRLYVKGYLKELPLVTLDSDFSDPTVINILHNRLNMRLDVSENLHLALEGRNRLLYDENFRTNPSYKDFVDDDPGLADLSWIWFSEGAWLGHTMVDRFYADWQQGNWQVRAGRQRINWGINMVSNPNDLFNVYSFFDFDYEEHPGTDALRIQYHWKHLSRVQLAVSPAKTLDESVAAVMFNFNHKAFDIQTLAGVYLNRLALGGGWSGNLMKAGFKGEVTWFYDLDNKNDLQRGNLVAAIGVDYLFKKGTYGALEALYNGGYNRDSLQQIIITEPLRPDNIMFSEFAITASVSHPFSPVVTAGLTAMYLPDIRSAFFSPNVTWNMFTDIDLGVMAQIFTAKEESIFSDAGSLWMMSLKYSF